MAGLQAADEELMAELFDDAAPGAPRDGVAGRVFELRDGVWTDVVHDEARRVVRVLRFSAAWFDVIGALPEIEPVLRKHESVVIAGEELSLQVSGEGAESLEPEDLAELVAGFRGTSGR